MFNFNFISGVAIPVVSVLPCLRLVQFGKGLPITCNCPVCAAKGQTPAQAFAAVSKANH